MDKCIYSKYCGGCSMQGISYPKQLEMKQEHTSNLLKKFGNVEEIIGCKHPTNYRNKVQVSFGYDDKRRLICGNYVSSTHMIVPIKECMIVDKRANELIDSVLRIATKYKISAFDEYSYKGCLRHLLIRTSNLGEVMLVLVTGSFNINKKEQFIRDILKYNPYVTTIVQNFNNKHTSMILGDKNTVLYGNGYIKDELCGLEFKISPSSFYQINRFQTEVLYNTALSLADFKGDETIIDAYCGTGTIGMIASKNVKKVLGVELNSFAIKDAIKNAKYNKIDNIEFVCDDAGHYMENMAKNHLHLDALIMDPPRSGASIKFLKSVLRLKPKKIIYISCGIESLRDNLSFLTRDVYSVKTIQPVDMFPYTSIGHVENIVVLERK